MIAHIALGIALGTWLLLIISGRRIIKGLNILGNDVDRLLDLAEIHQKVLQHHQYLFRYAKDTGVLLKESEAKNV